jgi:bifunctional DNA-binding transcriptional regulator/antitoxin component of YhaV-PrlF toxin-antitoxin module
VSADDPLARAVGEWRRKHNIAEGDPVIAVLELVRIYLRHSHKIDDASDTTPPTFEDFRTTMELLDRRSKAFVQQATDLVGELRRFGRNLKRLNGERLIVHCIGAAMGALVGMLIDRLL